MRSWKWKNVIWKRRSNDQWPIHSRSRLGIPRRKERFLEVMCSQDFHLSVKYREAWWEEVCTFRDGRSNILRWWRCERISLKIFNIQKCSRHEDESSKISYKGYCVKARELGLSKGRCLTWTWSLRMTSLRQANKQVTSRLPKRIERRVSKRHPYIHVHGSIGHKSQEKQAVQGSMDEQKDKQIAVYLYLQQNITQLEEEENFWHVLWHKWTTGT